MLRRDFLRVGALSFLGANLAEFLQLKHLLAADAARTVAVAAESGLRSP